MSQMPEIRTLPRARDHPYSRLSRICPRHGFGAKIYEAPPSFTYGGALAPPKNVAYVSVMFYGGLWRHNVG